MDADPNNPCLAYGKAQRCHTHDGQWTAHMNRYYLAASRFRKGTRKEDPGTVVDWVSAYRPQPMVGYLGLDAAEADELENLSVEAEAALRRVQTTGHTAQEQQEFQDKTERLIEHLDRLFYRRSQS